MGKFVVWVVGYALRCNLTPKERNEIVVHILTTLQAVPLSDIISTNEQGEMTVSGRTLDMESGKQLMSHARAAQSNQALHLIREQVKYESFVGATTKAALPEDLLFYRAALWWGQREEYFLAQLSQTQEELDL